MQDDRKFGRLKKMSFHMRRLAKYADATKSILDVGKREYIGQSRKKHQAYGAFGRHGGKLTAKQFEQYVTHSPHIRTRQVENLKKLVQDPKNPDRIDPSKQVTPEEFSQKLQDLTEDKQYPLSNRELGSIKRLFFG